MRTQLPQSPSSVIPKKKKKISTSINITSPCSPSSPIMSTVVLDSWRDKVHPACCKALGPTLALARRADPLRPDSSAGDPPPPVRRSAVFRKRQFDVCGRMKHGTEKKKKRKDIDEFLQIAAASGGHSVYKKLLGKKKTILYCSVINKLHSCHYPNMIAQRKDESVPVSVCLLTSTHCLQYMWLVSTTCLPILLPLPFSSCLECRSVQFSPFRAWYLSSSRPP